MIRRIVTFVTALLLLASLGSAAPTMDARSEDLKAYRLNLILFEHLQPDTREELSPYPQRPDLSFDQVVLSDTPLMENQVQVNPDTEFDLAQARLRLLNARRYRVIWAGAITTVMPADTTRRLRIDGAPGPQGLPTFQAVVAFRRSLYLHATLTFTAPYQTRWTHNWLDYVLPARRDLSVHGYMPVPAPIPDSGQSGQDKQLTGWWRMTQKQRVKIGQTTYYDHPRFSALVRVERAELPASEATQEAQLPDPLSQPPVPIQESP